jgi:uncharacterized protein YegJ (DUF2314 family)
MWFRNGLMIVALFAGSTPSVVMAKPNVKRIVAGDPEMEAAKAKGRETFQTFVNRFVSPQPGDSGFMVKFNLGPAPNLDKEFIWASDLRMDGDTLTGLLTDEPLAPGFRKGQRVPITADDIIDWGFFNNGALQGGFTERVLISRMSYPEAARQRANLGWR